MIIQQIDHLIQRILQNIQFMIQFNADCLISLLGWMTTLGSDLRRDSSPDNIIEFPGCLDRLWSPPVPPVLLQRYAWQYCVQTYLRHNL